MPPAGGSRDYMLNICPLSDENGLVGLHFVSFGEQ